MHRVLSKIFIRMNKQKARELSYGKKKKKNTDPQLEETECKTEAARQYVNYTIPEYNAF